jgi:hypothetical protein
MIKNAQAILKELFTALMAGILPPREEPPVMTPEELNQEAKKYD